MDVEACYELAAEFIQLRRENPDTPAMFHSRYATGGVEDTRGCHPFGIDHDGLGVDDQTVLIHNGVMFSPAMHDWRSDTRIFAEQVMRDVLKGTHNQSVVRKKLLAKVQPASMWSKNGRRKIESYLGGSNKLCVITVNPEAMSAKARFRGAPWEYALFNEDQGIWTREGVWHSNSGYVTPRQYGRTVSNTSQYWNSPATDWDSDEHGWASAALAAGDTCSGTGLASQFREAEEIAADSGKLDCEFCGRNAVDLTSLMCGNCQTCNDCYELNVDCQCYTPAGAKQAAHTDDGWAPSWATRPMAMLEAGESDDGSICDVAAIGTLEEKQAARAAFDAGELSYGEFLELTCGESWGCSCQSWCGDQGCLPDGDITFEVVKPDEYVPAVGDRVRLDAAEWPKGVLTVVQVDGDRVSLQTEGRGSITTDALPRWKRSGLKLVMRPACDTTTIPLTASELEEVAEEISGELCQ